VSSFLKQSWVDSIWAQALCISKPHSREAIPLVVIVKGSIEGYGGVSKVGRSSQFSLVNTVEKYLFKTFALDSFKVYVPLLSFRGGMPKLSCLLHLMYDHSRL